MIYPPDYIKNNAPEFYTEIEKQVSNPSFHLLFMGVAGCGKTHLADIILSALGNYRLYRASDYYLDYLELIKADDEYIKTKIRYYNEAPYTSLFLLDDLGCEKDTQASREFFAQFLQNDYDYIKAGRQSMSIITTNLDHTALNNRYGSRAIDRLFEYYGKPIFKFAAHSFRKVGVKVIQG